MKADDDDTKEAAADEMKEFAKAAEEKADWEKRLTKVNPFDGLIHNDDGSRQFTDDRQTVGGVNNYIKTHTRKHPKKSKNENHLHVPRKQKGHQSHAHVSHEQPQARGVQSLDAYLKKHTSLSHSSSRNDDDDAIKEAAKEELEEAGRVAVAKDQEAKEKASWEERLSKKNPFDGLVHNADGSRQFPDKGAVGGANNYASKSHPRSSRAQTKNFGNEFEDNSSQNEKDEEISEPETDHVKDFIAKTSLKPESDDSQSSVTLLKKLVNTAPAMGNIQERLERINDLKPTIESSIYDAKQAIKKQDKELESSESVKETVKELLKAKDF